MISDKAKYEIKVRFAKKPYMATRLEKAFSVSQAKNKNDFYLLLLEAGLKEFWNNEENKLFDKKHIKTAIENVATFSEQMKLCVDDIYIQNVVIKHLLVTLYNLKIKELDNVIVDSKEVENGNLSYMPDRLSFVLDKLKEDLGGNKKEENQR